LTLLTLVSSQGSRSEGRAACLLGEALSDEDSEGPAVTADGLSTDLAEEAAAEE
jgi:hypothetical protein